MRVVANRISYAKFFFWRLKVRAKDYREELNARKICMINPETIKYCLLEGFSKQQDQSEYVPVLSGSWDLLDKRIEDLDEYEAVKREVSESASVNRNRNEITVAIGREGDFMLANGLRALLTARKLQVQLIPVAIIARHLRWQELRKELYALALEKRLYQPATHPDLDIPAEHPCEDRFKIIRDNLSAQKGKILDIGADFGYFCHRFEELGFECYAVENDLKNLYYLRKLKRATGAKFKIVPEGIFEWEGSKALQFDVVLALNIFHHFLKRKKSYAKLIDLLKGLQMKELFFEPHFSNERQMKNAYKNYTEEEFVEFILQNSQLRRAKLVGTATDGRQLYKLS
jgi:2-polyprenyl-3-methyl-5-hydroxy-6-metoxy-1,4-benzoquinol methylase